jgi:hypothetical protein
MRISARGMAALAIAATGIAFAGPRIVEEQARLLPPDPMYLSVNRVAIDGNRALISATGVDASFEERTGVFAFDRAADGTWVPTGALVLNEAFPPATPDAPANVSMQGNIAAVATYGMVRIFERNGTAWTLTATFTTPPEMQVFGGGVDVDGTAVLVSGQDASNIKAVVFRRNASGQWVREALLVGGSADEHPEAFGSGVELSGDLALLPGNEDVMVYTRSAGTWTLSQVVDEPARFAGSFATDGQTLLVTKGANGPVLHEAVYAYTQQFGQWVRSRTLQAAEGVMERGWVVHASAGLGAQSVPDSNLRASGGGSFNVYDLSATGTERPVAKLVASDARMGGSLGRHSEMSGRRVIAASWDGAYVFDIPTNLSQPAIVQDDFENGSAAEWQPQAGGAFAVATPSNGSARYRQSSLTGDAISIRGNTNWTDQSIQADVKPIAFDGADRWFGLAVRYNDVGDRYYVTLRTSNVLQIRRKLGTSVVTLASANVTVTAGRAYRVRFEAIGTRLRAFVNGALVAEATDDALTQGRAAIAMYKASADYDNVVITPNPQTTLVYEGMRGLNTGWVDHGGSWRGASEGPEAVLEQSSLAGDSRFINGIVTEDQIVQARVRPMGFDGTDRWCGIAARYGDTGNFYYLSIRNTNQISLRRVSGGAITVLDSAPLTVSSGDWYKLRLEVVGNKLRGYVNGNLLVEATDSVLTKGQYAMVTYKAAARFDDFTVLQP